MTLVLVEFLGKNAFPQQKPKAGAVGWRLAINISSSDDMIDGLQVRCVEFAGTEKASESEVGPKFVAPLRSRFANIYQSDDT